MKNRKKEVSQIFDRLSNIIEKLDKKHISIDEAKAYASLIKQQNNILRYELDVAKLQVKSIELGIENSELFGESSI